MEKQRTKPGHSEYSCSAAAYQPDLRQLRRTVSLVFVLLTVLLIGLATRAHAVEKPANCVMLQGGIQHG
jgi:hypothetical protein